MSYKNYRAFVARYEMAAMGHFLDGYPYFLPNF
jgi:hypothetical protein